MSPGAPRPARRAGLPQHSLPADTPALRPQFAGVSLHTRLDLPELALGADPRRLDIALSGPPLLPEPPPAPRHIWQDPAGNPTLTLVPWAGQAHLCLAGIAQARGDGAQRIRVWRAPQASPESFRHVLLDQFLPRFLAASGALMLHGAAVSHPEHGTWLLLGDSGQGKSTLCAALAGAGASLLGDDCVHLDRRGEQWLAAATYPSLRLHADSLAALYGAAPPATTPVADYTGKLRVDHPGATQEAALPVPVDAILVLGSDTSTEQAAIRPLAAADAAISLVRNAFMFDPARRQEVARLLRLAAAAAAALPVYQLHYPRRYDALPSVVRHIFALGAG